MEVTSAAQRAVLDLVLALEPGAEFSGPIGGKQQKLDYGWPESAEEHVTLLLL